ncbi:MAG: hypothetical protein SFV15_00360 [Polyangiaceae bacterium]|nr:hypothetical protein [Polyangiaceae bacterium]
MESTADGYPANDPCGGGNQWIGGLRFANLALSTLNLPSLKKSCLNIGVGYCDAPCTSPNLVQVIAPQFTQGGVAFGNVPVLPKCRMDAVFAQLQAPVEYYNQYTTHIIMANPALGPCP